MIMAMIQTILMLVNNKIHSHIMVEEVIHSSSSNNREEEEEDKGSHSKVGKSSSLSSRPSFCIVDLYAFVGSLIHTRF
jgi:hypothetical protein